jgi:hypothetical protein
LTFVASAQKTDCERPGAGMALEAASRAGCAYERASLNLFDFRGEGRSNIADES